MRKTAFWAAVGVMLVGILGSATFALAHGFKKEVKAKGMSGYFEAPPVSSVASGSFKAKIDDNAQKIDYTLTYGDLEGDVLQAHIHFGQPGVSAGIMVWLCGTTGFPGPAGTPTCPGPRGGTVSGTITPAGVVGPSAQGIAVNEFNEVVRAIRAGRAYANVHSTKFTGGEIRAQLVGDHGRGHDK